MKKKYVAPVVEVRRVKLEGVITLSVEPTLSKVEYIDYTDVEDHRDVLLF